MSTVTLETLRADFERKIALYTVDHGYTGFDEMDELADWSVLFVRDLNRNGRALPRHSGPVCFAGALYAVARDYGLNAAMLYKLSGGNIDPRNPD